MYSPVIKLRIHNYCHFQKFPNTLPPHVTHQVLRKDQTVKNIFVLLRNKREFNIFLYN